MGAPPPCEKGGWRLWCSCFVVVYSYARTALVARWKMEKVRVDAVAAALHVVCCAVVPLETAVHLNIN